MYGHQIPNEVLGASHPQAMAGVRFASGIWLLGPGALLRSQGWWGALLIAAAALLFRVGYRLRASATN